MKNKTGRAYMVFSKEEIHVPIQFEGAWFVPLGNDFVFSCSSPEETKSGEIVVLQRTAGNNFIFNKSIMINKI